MKRSAAGDRLYRDLRVRVVIPGQKDIVWNDRIKQGRRYGWTAEQLSGMFDKFADQLEQRFPTIEFRVVELAPNQLNFIYAGRKGYNVEAPNLCPVVAQSQGIAEKVCSKQGHDIRVFQGQTRVTPQGPMMESMNFCTRCGFSVNEVRGQVEAMYRNAVQEGVRQLQASQTGMMKPEPSPGEPGIHLADVEAPKAASAEA